MFSLIRRESNSVANDLILSWYTSICIFLPFSGNAKPPSRLFIQISHAFNYTCLIHRTTQCMCKCKTGEKSDENTRGQKTLISPGVYPHAKERNPGRMKKKRGARAKWRDNGFNAINRRDWGRASARTRLMKFHNWFLRKFISRALFNSRHVRYSSYFGISLHLRAPTLANSPVNYIYAKFRVPSHFQCAPRMLPRPQRYCGSRVLSVYFFPLFSLVWIVGS